MVIDFLLNPWIITVVGGVTVVLITHYVFGIGKPKKSVANEPFKVKCAEEEITYEEKLRSLKMDVGIPKLSMITGVRSLSSSNQLRMIFLISNRQ